MKLVLLAVSLTVCQTEATQRQSAAPSDSERAVPTESERAVATESDSERAVATESERASRHFRTLFVRKILGDALASLDADYSSRHHTTSYDKHPACPRCPACKRCPARPTRERCPPRPTRQRCPVCPTCAKCKKCEKCRECEECPEVPIPEPPPPFTIACEPCNGPDEAAGTNRALQLCVTPGVPCPFPQA